MRAWHENSYRESISLQSTSAGSPLALFFLQLVDFGLLGILFVAPFFLGGRHALGQFIFGCFIGLSAFSWCAYQLLIERPQWTISKANLLGVAAVGLVAVQILPLPAAWLECLAPRNSALLNLFNAAPDTQPNLGPWQTLSLTPSMTKSSLAMLVSYFLLFTLAVQRLKKIADVQRLLAWIALSAVVMAGFGLLQYYTSNGLFFWFYEVPFTSTHRVAKGGFTCKNHYAHFITLGLGPLLAWCLISFRQLYISQNNGTNLAWAKLTCAVLGIALIVVGVMLSLSRGGMLVLALSGSFIIFLYYVRGLISSSYLLGLGLLGLLILAALSVEGYNNVVERVSDFSSASVDQLDSGRGRRDIWAANLSAIREGSWFGSGAGSHSAIYPIYLNKSFDGVYTHAESGYLQIVSENGWLGGVLLLLGFVWICHWAWQALSMDASPKQTLLVGAVVAGLLVSVIHAIFDFVWYIPACMTLTLLLAACLLRLVQLNNTNEKHQAYTVTWSKSRWLVAFSLVVFTVIKIVSTLMGPAGANSHWDRYLLIADQSKRQSLYQLQAAKNSGEDSKDKIRRLKTMVYHLRSALAFHAEDADCHLRLAAKYLQLFEQLQRKSENAMSVEQIRQAARASSFGSARELQQWLRRAIGGHCKLLYLARHHTMKSLRFNPLNAQAYLYLAKLCFLAGQNTEHIAAYANQSLEMSPHDGGIVFQVGKEKLMLGCQQEAIHLWQKSYRHAGNHQLQIIELLAKITSASAFLDAFQPDWKTLPYVWRHFFQTSSPEQRDILLQYAKQAANAECPQATQRIAATIWHRLAKMQIELGHDRAAMESLHSAIRAAPEFYVAHQAMGQLLLRDGEFVRAEKHLRWCRARRPDDASVCRSLELAVRGGCP